MALDACEETPRGATTASNSTEHPLRVRKRTHNTCRPSSECELLNTRRVVAGVQTEHGSGLRPLAGGAWVAPGMRLDEHWPGLLPEARILSTGQSDPLSAADTAALAEELGVG